MTQEVADNAGATLFAFVACDEKGRFARPLVVAIQGKREKAALISHDEYRSLPNDFKEKPLNHPCADPFAVIERVAKSVSVMQAVEEVNALVA